MYEDAAAFVKTIKEATGRDHDREWAAPGSSLRCIRQRDVGEAPPNPPGADRRREAEARRLLLPSRHRKASAAGQRFQASIVPTATWVLAVLFERTHFTKAGRTRHRLNPYAERPPHGSCRELPLSHPARRDRPQHHRPRRNLGMPAFFPSARLRIRTAMPQWPSPQTTDGITLAISGATPGTVRCNPLFGTHSYRTVLAHELLQRRIGYAL